MSCFPERFANNFEFSDTVLPDSVLIIRDFCHNIDGKRYSFAFELDPILNAQNMTSKAWITISPERTSEIRHYPDYKKFEHGNETFYPYSIELSKYIGNAENLKKICINIYQCNIKHDG